MPHKKTVRFDLDDKQITGLTLGADVTVQIKGEVREMEASRMGFDYDAPVPVGGKREKKTKIPAVATMEIASIRIMSAKRNEFADLADDEEEK